MMRNFFYIMFLVLMLFVVVASEAINFVSYHTYGKKIITKFEL